MCFSAMEQESIIMTKTNSVFKSNQMLLISKIAFSYIINHCGKIYKVIGFKLCSDIHKGLL